MNIPLLSTEYLLWAYFSTAVEWLWHNLGETRCRGKGMYFMPSILHPSIARFSWFMWVKQISPLFSRICIPLENLVSFSFSVTAVRIHQHSAQEYKANRLLVIWKQTGLVKLKMKYYYRKDSFIWCFVQRGKMILILSPLHVGL